jgi:hypothetical protein
VRETTSRREINQSYSKYCGIDMVTWLSLRLLYYSDSKFRKTGEVCMAEL